MNIVQQPIGIIHSPFRSVEHMPIQPVGAAGICGEVELFAEFAAGLKDLEGFSHIILLYHFHRAGEPRLIVMPFLDVEPHGVFATRAPARPNLIGLSVVKLLSVEGNLLHIENVDILDGTPLLDIKPYVPAFDHHEVERTGWLASANGKVADKKSDGRFEYREPSIDERRDAMDQPTLFAVCRSLQRSDPKSDVGEGELRPGWGLVGDSHAGPARPGRWEISLLAWENAERLNREHGLGAIPGRFAENLSTLGLDTSRLHVGHRLRIGEQALLEVEQLGKPPEMAHTYSFRGHSLLPTVGVFCRVVQGGVVRAGDPICLQAPEA